MRRTLITLISLLATPAMAATIPLAGSYGDTYGCKVPVQGDIGVADKDWHESWILITPAKIRGHEWECSVRSVHGPKVAASCSEADDNAPQRTAHLTVIEHRTAGTVTYSDEATTVTLRRCRS